MALEHGLLLVDTKYEFGKTSDGTIVLIDEVKCLLFVVESSFSNHVNCLGLFLFVEMATSFKCNIFSAPHLLNGDANLTEYSTFIHCRCILQIPVVIGYHRLMRTGRGKDWSLRTLTRYVSETRTTKNNISA